MKNTLFALGFALSILILPSITKAHEDMACTMQYQPVCGTEKGVYKTYGNGCTLSNAHAVYEHEGECTKAELAGKQEGAYAPPAHCVAWSDGCNSCSRGTNGQAACTLMACMGEPRAGYCKAYAETGTDTAPEPKPAPDASVASGPAVTAPAPDVTVEASTTAAADAQPGLFARIWASIATWFSGIF